jgi:filamentous hemagglutinin family protein
MEHLIMRNYKAINNKEIYRKGFLTSIKTMFSKLMSKVISKNTTIVFINALAFSFISLSTPAPAFANPQGGIVAAGIVSIQQQPNSTVINQSSQQAIINWQSFNIGASEATHFQQPTGGIALNRISAAQGASQIFGQLTATGTIILINQAGIYFGPTARVDVGGIIASTSDISDQNFLAGKYIFDKPSPYNGSIINQGTIIAANHGLVALLGTAVSNEGMIQANSGTVILASGNKFTAVVTVDLTGDQLINFTVDEKATSAGVSPIDGTPLKNGVNNSGTIIANGGTILMTAATAEGVLDRAINMSGVAIANSVGTKNGEIILSADGGCRWR